MTHKNRGFDGYGQPAYGGRQAAMVAYHATMESYAASKEEVVTYGGGYPTTHAQIRRPRNSTHVQPDDYSPKLSHTNGSPRDYSTKFNGSPRDYSPKFNGSPHDSPRKAFHRAHSPPPGHYSGMYDSPRKDFSGGFGSADDDSSDDDGECRDGVCYPKPNHGGYVGGGGGGGGGNYHQPRKDPLYHHQTPDLHKYYNTAHDQKQPEGNNMYGSNSYTHTKPTDPYYDNNNYTHSKNDPYTGKSSNGKLPAPIKTRATDHYRDGRNSPVSGGTQWTPFAASPRKDRKEVIDSTEAQRRYGNAPPQSAEQKYRATIDSETAAKMYGGVFVT